MSMFVIYDRLSQLEANVSYQGITKWFKNNPRRKVCKTDYFNVRRGHVKEDLLKHSVKDAVITEQLEWETK